MSVTLTGWAKGPEGAVRLQILMPTYDLNEEIDVMRQASATYRRTYQEWAKETGHYNDEERHMRMILLIEGLKGGMTDEDRKLAAEERFGSDMEAAWLVLGTDENGELHVIVNHTGEEINDLRTELV